MEKAVEFMSEFLDVLLLFNAIISDSKYFGTFDKFTKSRLTCVLNVDSSSIIFVSFSEKKKRKIKS